MMAMMVMVAIMVMMVMVVTMIMKTIVHAPYTSCIGGARIDGDEGDGGVHDDD